MALRVLPRAPTLDQNAESPDTDDKSDGWPYFYQAHSIDKPPIRGVTPMFEWRRFCSAVAIFRVCGGERHLPCRSNNHIWGHIVGHKIFPPSQKWLESVV